MKLIQYENICKIGLDQNVKGTVANGHEISLEQSQ